MSKFKRILLKLSGEALAGEKGHGIDNQILSDMASEIASIVKQGVQVALVIGGGNLVRGISASAGGMNRAQGDAMGMLGTVMNGLAMQDALDKQGVDSVVMSAIRMEPVCEFFDRRKALKLLSAGSVVIFSAGTGNPFFTTDSCAALRAIESECDVIMKATGSHFPRPQGHGHGSCRPLHGKQHAHLRVQDGKGQPHARGHRRRPRNAGALLRIFTYI